MILGFGQPHVEETRVLAKSLAVACLLHGRDEFARMHDEEDGSLKSRDKLAGIIGYVLHRSDHEAVIHLVQYHINRSHPFSPDGVAALRVVMLGVAHRDWQGNVFVTAGEQETVEEALAV